MKKNIILAFLLLLCCSCSEEKEQPNRNVPATRGLVYVSIEEGAYTDERLESLRCFVFTDMAGLPRLEYHGWSTRNPPERFSEVNYLLEVERKADDPNEKLIVVIVNEPNDIDLRKKLQKVATPGDLANLELEMSHFLNDDHLSLKAGTVMPMSGAVWASNSVYTTKAEAEANRVALSLERVVARVDVYLNTDIPEGLQIAAGSTVALDSTYTKSYWIRHESGSRALGNIQTVEGTALIGKTWTQTAPSLSVPYHTPAYPWYPSSVLACSFYTPERNCLSDKLRLDIGVRTVGDDGFKSGSLVLTTARDEQGIAHPVDVVRRNSIYKVTATIGVNDITAVVQDWNGVEIPTEL